jgi:hypothetical protein
MLEEGWVGEKGLLRLAVGLEVGTVRRWMVGELVQSSTEAGWEVDLAQTVEAKE